MQLFSFWKADNIYEVKVRGYRIKIFTMEEEFGQEEEFDKNMNNIKLLFVEVKKERKTLKFNYLISKEKYWKEDFTEVIHEATYKWGKEYRFGRTN